MKNTSERKTRLGPREKIEVAHRYWIMGEAQHVIAARFEVNQGRVSEALNAIRKVIPGLP